MSRRSQGSCCPEAKTARINVLEVSDRAAIEPFLCPHCYAASVPCRCVYHERRCLACDGRWVWCPTHKCKRALHPDADLHPLHTRNFLMSCTLVTKLDTWQQGSQFNARKRSADMLHHLETRTNSLGYVPCMCSAGFTMALLERQRTRLSDSPDAIRNVVKVAKALLKCALCGHKSDRTVVANNQLPVTWCMQGHAWTVCPQHNRVRFLKAHFAAELYDKLETGRLDESRYDELLRVTAPEYEECDSAADYKPQCFCSAKYTETLSEQESILRRIRRSKYVAPLVLLTMLFTAVFHLVLNAVDTPKGFFDISFVRFYVTSIIYLVVFWALYDWAAKDWALTRGLLLHLHAWRDTMRKFVWSSTPGEKRNHQGAAAAETHTKAD